MFSKILAFGLGALALVNAAPAVFSFQTPMLSCSVNMLGTSQAAVKSFDEFPGPGRYKISNTAFPDSQLVARQMAQPVTLSSPGQGPGPIGMWDILPALDESAGYLIINVGLRAATSSFRDVIVAGGTTAAPFAIEPAGGKEYVIKLPNEDKVWSLGSPFEALHLEPQQGAAKQLWRFEAVNDD
ncbi:hypothetical protein K438DRAFT_1971089 [Mycena galopus ATCC 62051]|nr:hypothetical protein K438DRAFT_1971089 [Mycena galopus ATCC 62051]